MLPAHQLQGELVIPVHTYMQSCPHTHAPGGANIRASSCPKVPVAVIAVASVRPFLPGHCCRNLGYVASVGPFLPSHCCRNLGETTVFSLTEKTVVLQQSFKYFVLPKALKPYKKLQKCQKLLANFGSEDTV